MPESRFLKLIIIALLLINGGTLAFLFLRQANAPRPRREGGNTAEYLNRTLRLTDAQEQQYRKMRDRHHASHDSLQENMRMQEAHLYRLLSNPNAVAERNAGAMMDSIAGQQREIERITFEHFREFRAICTPEQQRKFDEVISEALERMR